MQNVGKFPVELEATVPAVPGQAPRVALASVAPATGCPSQDSAAVTLPAGKVPLTGLLFENVKLIVELPLSAATPQSLKLPSPAVVAVRVVTPSSASVVTVKLGTPADPSQA